MWTRWRLSTESWLDVADPAGLWKSPHPAPLPEGEGATCDALPEACPIAEVTISVVVPVYNEAAIIGADLQTIFEAMDKHERGYEVLVVDDGSIDDTAQIVADYPRARLVRHERNQGVGAARKTGMAAARGDIIVTTDGDGTYPNHEIPRLLDAMAHNDMVVGARVREAGTWPWLRAPAKAFIRTLASYLTGVRIPDLNSGLRCFRKGIAEQYVPLLPDGHSSESTITIAFLTGGYRVAFVPIDYYPRRSGRSSFHPIRDTAAYLGLVMRTIMITRGNGAARKSAAAGGPVRDG